jgi:hypothetical protein
MVTHVLFHTVESKFTGKKEEFSPSMENEIFMSHLMSRESFYLVYKRCIKSLVLPKFIFGTVVTFIKFENVNSMIICYFF